MERKLEDLSPRASAEVIRVLTSDRRRLIEALTLMVERFGYADWTSVHDAEAVNEARALLAEMKERTL